METMLINGLEYVAKKGVEAILDTAEAAVAQVVEGESHERSVRDHAAFLHFSQGPVRGANGRKVGKSNKSTLSRELKDTVLMRRITTQSTLSASAGGSLVMSNHNSDEARTNGSQFATYAAVYSAFRVRRITFELYPCAPTSTGDVANASVPIYHSILGLAPYYGDGPAPTTIDDLLSNPRCKIVPTYQVAKYTANVGDFNDGKLFSPVNAAMASSDIFAIYFCGPAGVFTANYKYYHVVIIWDVEFKSMV